MTETTARDIKVTLPFGGEDRVFTLTRGPLQALEKICDAGPAELLNRFGQNYRVNDVRETLRQGLIGGGMTDAESTKLMKLHFDDRPLREFVPAACAVLGAALVGAPGGQAV